MSTTAMILSKISQSLWFDHNIYLVMHFGPFWLPFTTINPDKHYLNFEGVFSAPRRARANLAPDLECSNLPYNSIVQLTKLHQVTTSWLYYNSTVDQFPPVASRQLNTTGGDSSTIYILVEMWVNPVDEIVYSRLVSTSSNKWTRNCFNELPLHSFFNVHFSNNFITFDHIHFAVVLVQTFFS